MKIIKLVTVALLLTTIALNAQEKVETKEPEKKKKVVQFSGKQIVSTDITRAMMLTPNLHYEYLLTNVFSVNTSFSLGLLGLNSTIGGKVYPFSNNIPVAPYVGAKYFYSGKGTVLAENVDDANDLWKNVSGVVALTPGVAWCTKNNWVVDANVSLFYAKDKVMSSIIPEVKIGKRF